MCAQVRQHYVPQFYLREFLDPTLEAKGQNVLWLYEAGRHPSKKSVKDVGYGPDFYEIPAGTGNAPEAEEPGFLEKRLQQMEAVAAPTLRKLAQGDFQLTAQQRGEFAGFIALTMCRTPFFARMIDELVPRISRANMKQVLATPGRLEELMAQANLSEEKAAGLTVEKLRDFAQRVADGRVKSRQTNRGYTMKMMFVAMREYMDHFDRMRWGLVRAAPGEYFITCDNAVVVMLPGEREKPTLESAYFPPETQFFFPVGRSYILTGRMENGPDRTGRATPRMMKDMQRFQVFRAHKEIYAPFKSDKLREQNDKMSAGKRIVVPDLPDEWFVI